MRAPRPQWHLSHGRWGAPPTEFGFEHSNGSRLPASQLLQSFEGWLRSAAYHPRRPFFGYLALWEPHEPVQRWSPRAFQRWYSGPSRPSTEAISGDAGAGEGEGEGGGGGEGEREGEGGTDDAASVEGGGGGSDGAPLEGVAAAVDVGGGHCAWRRQQRAPARVYYGCLSQVCARGERSVYMVCAQRVRSVCAVCARRVRSVCAACARCVRGMCAPCARFVYVHGRCTVEVLYRAASLPQLDAAVGRMLATLTALGVRDNTLLLLSSDNGCCPYPSRMPCICHAHARLPPSPPSLCRPEHREVNSWGSAAGLRGAKGFVYEGGIRVPLLLQAPRGFYSITHRL